MTHDPAPSAKKTGARGGSRREFLGAMTRGITAAALGATLETAKAAPPPNAGTFVATGDTDPRLAAYDSMMMEFMLKYRPPGAALAVSKDGRLVYARGFGFADVERREPARPLSLFRIASISKPFTSTAVFQLVQQGRLRLDDKVFAILKLQPFLERGARLDERIHAITVHHCLQHTAGWDRDKGFDPMGAAAAEEVAHALGVPLPIGPEHIIRYTMGRPLDWNPGTKYAYSNFGYCVLGRVIEAASGMHYQGYVARFVLQPLGITHMRQGRNLLRDRAPGEVKYYDSMRRTGRAISGPNIGRQAPLPYGVECIETMDANGGWIASPIMLVRFADAFNDIRNSKLLDEQSIRTMLARPPGAPGLENGRPAAAYYGCGWDVRPIAERLGKYTKWHGGLLAGSSTLLVARADGINWAITFNCDADSAGKEFAATIDSLLHQPADRTKDWPDWDLYGKFAL
jgi:CubicO group peptidase (beta-lactamase class C family)